MTDDTPTPCEAINGKCPNPSDWVIEFNIGGQQMERHYCDLHALRMLGSLSGLNDDDPE